MVTVVKEAAPAAEGVAPGAAEFEQLANEAAAMEGQGAPGAAEPAPIGPDPREVLQIVTQLRMLRSMTASRFAWWPEFRNVWSDDTLQAIATALAEVMALHGWSIDQLMGRFGPYIALAFCVGAPCFVTHEAIKERREAIARAERARAAGPSAAPPGQAQAAA